MHVIKMTCAHFLKTAAGLWLLAGAGLAQAQLLEPISPGEAAPIVDPMTAARTAMARHDPAEALSRYLRVLSQRPNDLDALTGAGRAALDVGDASAAIGFYARAEQVAPRNGRVKAGLGSAMVQMENAKAALKLFDDAVDLGVPEPEIASDRGLAYDLRGDSRRAQQDYALALKIGADPETIRRFALSLAITGDRQGAMTLLDPLLRRQDVPAWRARAFVLALTGDPLAADVAAKQVMPRPQAEALAPFLAKLPTLKPGQQAAAVNFGHFPSEGRKYSDAELFADATPPDPAPAQQRTTSPYGPGVRLPDGVLPDRPIAGLGTGDSYSSAPRRRPGSEPSAPPTNVVTARAEPSFTSRPAQAMPPPAQTTPAPPQPAARSVMGPPVSLAGPVVSTAPKPTPVLPEPGFATLPENTVVTAGKPKPAPVKLAQAEPPAAKPKEKPKPAEDAKAKSDKTKAKDDPKDKTAEKGKDTKDTKDKNAKDKDSKSKDAKAEKDKKEKDAKSAKSKIPERYWVQVAGGARKADLPRAYSNLKEKWPKQLSGRSAYTTPLRATNRLLIGPFKTADEAQAYVNANGKAGFFPYTSPAGLEIEKLPAK